MAIRWINAGRVSHYRSQSIYHGLGYAQAPETPNTVVLVIPENPYICVGYFQDAAKEVDLAYCRTKDLPVIRRETGGGTVYIDPGQMFVQWICQPGFLPRKVEQRFQLFNQAMVETHAFFGIQAYHHPVNDVHVNGKKIVGTGAATIGQAEVITGNFLFDFDTEVMTAALNSPHADFRRVLKSSLDTYMTWIRRELSQPPSFQEVTDAYRIVCSNVLGEPVIDGNFTEEELSAISVAEAKLKREDWLHTIHHKPSTNRLVKIHAGVWLGWMTDKVAGKSIQVFSQLRNNILERVRFYLDGLNPSWGIDKLERVLISSPLVDEEIRFRLSSFFADVNTADMIMTTDEWTKVIMNVQNELRKASGYA
jgi:lipoate-protein ligase A